MRKLALLLCLALAAGLFVSSCGKGGGAAQNGGAGAENLGISSGLGDATENKLQQKDDGTQGKDGPEEPGSGPEEPGSGPGLGSVDVEEILSGARISGSRGSCVFSFHHPQVPDGLHLCVSLRVFREEDDGDRLMFSYDSDGAWMARPQDYDPSERNVKVPVDVKDSLSDLYVMVSAKVTDESGEVLSAMAVRDSDGCMTEGFEDIFSWSGAR